MRAKHLLAFSSLLLLLGLVCACGYRVASKNRIPAAIQSLSILPLENRTATFEVEQILTRSLIRAFVEGSGLQVVSNPEAADALFQGSVVGLTARPVTFGEGAFGSTFLVTLNLEVELKERASGKVLFRNNNYIFREQYVINVDERHFFSELNPALERIARDFASSVVTTVLENL